MPACSVSLGELPRRTIVRGKGHGNDNLNASDASLDYRNALWGKKYARSALRIHVLGKRLMMLPGTENNA